MLSQVAWKEPARKEIDDAVAAINSQRIKWLMLIMAVVHIAHIAIFWPRAPLDPDEPLLWRTGVITAHAATLLFLAVLGLAKYLVERSERWARPGMIILSQIAALGYLLHAVSTATIDQMITPAITPIMIASTGVAIAIVLRPAAAAINYSLFQVAFIVAVGFTQPDPDLLLSVRVNSISATGLGFGLALLQWRGQVLAIRQQRRIEAQQRELEAKNRELTLLATRDPLTGLLNRTQFFADANREAARMARTGRPACLLLIDVDHFKQVNDTYGHPSGDAILVAIARAMSAVLRPGDLLSRLGGEEFAVLLPETTPEGAAALAERLRTAIAGLPVPVGPRVVMVTVSIGVAPILVGDQGADAVEEGYRAADQALYRAKAEGRNCIRPAHSRSIQ